MKRYSLRVLIAFDQFVNTLVGGRPNETLSARAWRKGAIEGSAPWEHFQIFTDGLFSPIHNDHCESSYLYLKNPNKTCGVYFPVICTCNQNIPDDDDYAFDITHFKIKR